MKRGKMRRSMGMVAFLMGVMVFAFAGPGLSQEKFPVKPVTIVHGWGPGGAQDNFTRLMGNMASKDLGQPVVVENKPGAHGIVAATSVLASKPDGYTLATSVSSQFLVVPFMQKLYYDPINDPVHVLVYLHYDLGLVVRADSPWKTWEEFKTYAKKNPGKIRYGTYGVGTAQHLTFEIIAQKEGIKWIHMPFSGGNEPSTMLLGGHIEAAIVSPTEAYPHVKQGTLRLLVVLNPDRWEMAPNVPHIGELGYANTLSYNSIYGPKGLPEPVRLKLANAFRKAIQSPEFIAAAKNVQMHVVYMDGREYGKLLKEKAEMYKKIIADLHLDAK